MSLSSPLRPDAPSSPLTVYEGGIDVMALTVPRAPSVQNGPQAIKAPPVVKPDDFPNGGSFDFVLDIIARYKIEDVRVEIVRDTYNMLVFAHFNFIDDETSTEIFAMDFPAGYFFNGINGEFKADKTFEGLPYKTSGTIVENCIGYCAPNGPFRVHPMTMLSHDLDIMVEEPLTKHTQLLSFKATPKPTLPYLSKIGDTGSVVYFLDRYGICKFDLRLKSDLPGGNASYVFRDEPLTKESPLKAFQMIFATPTAVPFLESISLNTLDRAFGVYLEPPLQWNNVRDVSLWKHVVHRCVKAFEDFSKIRVSPFLVGVHYGSMETRVKATSKRIDGVDTNIFSADLRFFDESDNSKAFVQSMRTMLAFLKDVDLESLLGDSLFGTSGGMLSAAAAAAASSSSSSSSCWEVDYEPVHGGPRPPFSAADASSSSSSSSSSSKPKRRILDDDDSDDDSDFVRRPQKTRKQKTFTNDTFKQWFRKNFQSFGKVGGRGGCKRGEAYERMAEEKREEKLEELRVEALKVMDDDEYDELVAETKEMFGVK